MSRKTVRRLYDTGMHMTRLRILLSTFAAKATEITLTVALSYGDSTIRPGYYYRVKHKFIKSNQVDSSVLFL